MSRRRTLAVEDLAPCYRLHITADGETSVALTNEPLEHLLGGVRNWLENGAERIRLEEADSGRLVVAVDRVTP